MQASILICVVARLVVLLAPIVSCTPSLRGVRHVGDVTIPNGKILESGSDMHVVYSTDADNFEPLLHSMISLSRHLKEPAMCTINLIVPDADRPAAERLVACFLQEWQLWSGQQTTSPNVVVHALRPLPFNTSGNGFFEHLQGKDTVFTRLVLPDYLPGVQRAIWLDTDTIVKTDLSMLHSTRLDAAMGAVYEDLGTWENVYISIKPSLAAAVPYNHSEHIFNTGVLLYDLVRWRAERIVETLAERMRSVSQLGVDDQLLMNLHFHGRVQHLDPRWNFQVQFNPPKDLDDGAWIAHWAGGPKPWKGPAIRKDVFDKFAPHPNCATA